MKRTVISCLVGTAIAACVPPQDGLAADARAGQQKASICMSCHGVDGISRTPLVPNLAGQKEAYLIKALKDYREGRRDNAIMRSMASDLSDGDIADLAAFFAGMPRKTK